MSKLELNRRSFLRGAGGVAVALPALEAMMDARVAHAQSTPVKRFVMMTSGQSLGPEGPDGNPNNSIVPTATGALTAALKPGLAPLESLKSDLTIVSGLQIPSQGLDGYNDYIPTAGKPEGTHDSTNSPLFAGTAYLYDGMGWGPKGTTGDWKIWEAIGGGAAKPFRAYRVQDAAFTGHYSEITARKKNDWVQSVASPQAVFNSLFQNFVPPNTGGGPTPEELAVQRRNARRASVLDAVRVTANTLLGRLGARDATRLRDHLDHIRSLETRIQAMQNTPPANTEACYKPATPGAHSGQDDDYNDEVPRGELLVDLMALSFICDLSRVASMQITFSMPMMTLPGHTDLMHEESHGGNQSQFILSTTWHTGLLARLMQKLKDTEDVVGNMLDNTCICYMWEAGWGRDGQADGTTTQAHSTDNMVVLIGGGAGGKINKGMHFRPEAVGTHPSGAAKPRHPASVLISCMNAMDVPTTTLGDVSGGIDGVVI